MNGQDVCRIVIKATGIFIIGYATLSIPFAASRALAMTQYLINHGSTEDASAISIPIFFAGILIKISFGVLLIKISGWISRKIYRVHNNEFSDTQKTFDPLALESVFVGVLGLYFICDTLVIFVTGIYRAIYVMEVSLANSLAYVKGNIWANEAMITEFVVGISLIVNRTGLAVLRQKLNALVQTARKWSAE